MKRLITLLLFFTFAAKAQTGVSVPSMAAFDAAMYNLMTTHGLPGGQLAITYQGRLVYNRGFGYANTTTQDLVQPESRFRIASISKPLTSAAIMKLFEQGLLGLDAKVFGVNGILNDTIYQSILDPQVLNITVRNLLQHTSGWDRNVSGDPMFNAYNIAITMGTTPPADPVTVIRFVLQYKMLDFAPGAQSAYSNLGYCILGRVIEKITGQTYADYVKNNILLPSGITDMDLGMNLTALPGEVSYYDYSGAPLANSIYNNVSQVPTPYGGFNLEAMDANGGWIASGESLCKLLCAIDKFNSRPDILLPATIDTMVKPSVQDPYYACGMAVNTFNNWWHNGGLPGTATEFVRSGSQEKNWALLFNSRSNNQTAMYNDIDNLVWSNLASVSSWPSHDLFTTSVGEHQGVALFEMYPVPAGNSITISMNDPVSKKGNLEIADIAGKVIYSSGVNSINTIETSQWQNGVYIVKMVSEKGSYSRKLIIAH